MSKDVEISGMVAFIRNLDYIGGSETPLTDSEKDLLFTKVISLERIGNDF